MKKISFLKKQLIAYSLLMTAVVLFLIFLAHSYVINTSRERAEVTQELLTATTLDQVDSYLDHLMHITTQISHDSEIVSYMETLCSGDNDPDKNYFGTPSADRRHVTDLLAKHNDLKNPVFRIALFNTCGDFVSTDLTPEVLRNGESYIAQSWFQKFLPRAFGTEARDFILMGPMERLPEDVLNKGYIYMMMPIRNHDGSETYGYVQVYQSLEPLFSQLDLSKQADIDVYLFYEVNLGGRGKQFYPADKTYPDLSAGSYHETFLQSDYGWFVVLLQDQNAFLASYRSMVGYLYLGGLAMLLLLFVCVYLIVRHTSKPILNLSHQVRETTLANLPDLPVTHDAMDEVKELEQAFEQMMLRLKSSLALEQQAYLKALQAQMKPHFLYNCLATISSMAVELDDEAIPRFCDYLTSILWYESTYENGLVTLDEELRNLKNYLELMKMRFENDLSCEFDVEESLLQLRLPRLVLQPLAENCFDHGFRTVPPPWRISLRIYREDKQWVISISDNGSGFDAEKQRQLENQIQRMTTDLGGTYSEMKIGGIGLANTIVRLRLLLDGSVTYHIAAKEGRGSVITLKGDLHD